MEKEGTKMTKLEQLEQTAKELLAEIVKMKGIDLNNTWCEATEENYKALVELGYKTLTNIYKRSVFIWITDDSFSVYNCKLNEATVNHHKLKQIHLINGKFQFVKTALETMKEKYESGEYICLAPVRTSRQPFEIIPKDKILAYSSNAKLIHKKHAHILDAYLKDNSVQIFEIDTFCNEHREYKVNNFIDEYKDDAIYELKEKPKQWYEIESNFPCLVLNLRGNLTVVQSSHKYKEYKDEYLRLATKEEVLSLLVEP